MNFCLNDSTSVYLSTLYENERNTNVRKVRKRICLLIVPHPAPKRKPIIDPLANLNRSWPLIGPVSPDKVPTGNPLFMKASANCQGAMLLNLSSSGVSSFNIIQLV